MSLLTAVISLQMIATLLNPKNPETDIVSFAIGFIPLVLIPSLFILLKPLDKNQIKKIELTAATIMGLWSLVVISQSLIGWKISGVSIVTGQSFTRAQGFYSHPLTLAYVGLMLWPLNFVRLTQNYRDIGRIICLISNMLLLYFSASRTAQAVALLLLVGYVLWSFRGRVRLLIFGLIAASVVGILITPNAISRRFMKLGTAQISEEKESGFVDDRVAFWIVHSNMVKERPILGHGINLNRAYRVPYYDAIGLHDFKKAYEAHNQLLQLAAEGGLVCALAFLAWMISLHWNWSDFEAPWRRARDLTIVGLFLGGLTQNAYFDGEVRFALILVMSLAFAYQMNRFRPSLLD
ncbi:MAG: O-antigen ligase domain-containing protein [Proteobacteria bacterium]|nr:MAG: O-antigen ligase domain-containing protein [Pseudomonadota bacterium]